MQLVFFFSLEAFSIAGFETFSVGGDVIWPAAVDYFSFTYSDGFFSPLARFNLFWSSMAALPGTFMAEPFDSINKI